MATRDGDLGPEAVIAGTTGILPKYSSRDRFLDTVRDVARGEYRIPGEVVRQLV